MSGLQGRRVVVTRQKSQAGGLAERLQAKGATVLEVPAIDIVPPRDIGPLDEALESLDRYDWVVLTSANTVNAVLSRLTVLGLYPKLGSETRRVASVGPATTAALRSSFPEDRRVLEPKTDFRAAGLLDAFSKERLKGRRMLVPASSEAREELASGLRGMGALVEVVAAYSTIEPPGLGEAVALPGAGLRPGPLRISFGPSRLSPARRGPRRLPAAVIGPTTEAAARAAGLDVRGVASPSTLEALVATAERVLGDHSDSIPLTRLRFHVWPWTVLGLLRVRPKPLPDEISRKLEDQSPPCRRPKRHVKPSPRRPAAAAPDPIEDEPTEPGFDPASTRSCSTCTTSASATSPKAKWCGAPCSGSRSPR
jgi:uroporphyrinogen-III synthase